MRPVVLHILRACGQAPCSGGTCGVLSRHISAHIRYVSAHAVCRCVVCWLLLSECDSQLRVCNRIEITLVGHKEPVVLFSL